jgi:hypothetical protein
MEIAEYLALYTKAIELVNACTFPTIAAEIEALPDPMDRLRAYAEIAGNLKPERMLAEIRLRAERRACEAIGRYSSGRRIRNWQPAKGE